MRTFGIIGRPLGHSFSKGWFERLFTERGLTAECRFENFELAAIGELEGVLAHHGTELEGFCVTIPYKKEIMARLDEVSPEAAAIGAVNCVRVRGGRLSGYNTDAHGFRVGLDELLGQADRGELKALVLGTGGASCAVRYVLEGAGIDYRMVSRTAGEGVTTYAELTPEVMDTHRLVVNTTPLGTWPNVEGKPDLPYDAVGAGHYLYDLVYNPPVTAFLAEGEQRGARTIGGLAMLEAQAARNAEIWEIPER